jgi:signal transduction histidine kinase
MNTYSDTRITSLEHAELISRVWWLIRLRWAFGVGVTAIGAFCAYESTIMVRGPLITGLGLGIIGYNCAFLAFGRWLVHRRPSIYAERAQLAACVQIILDLVFLTMVLQGAGGIENPFFIFYVFHMVIATLLLPAREVFGLAGLAILLFAGMAFGEMNGWWPHACLFDCQGLYRDPRVVLVTLTAFASALLIAVYLGTSIARQLRSRASEVLRLRSELAARAEELERSNTALRELDEAKTRHYRKISHELKAPLAAQKTLLNAALIELEAVATDAPLARIRRAMARGDEMLALVKDLMVLAEMRALSGRPALEWVDPMVSLRSLLDDEELRAREKGLTWRVETSEKLPQVRSEPRALPMIAGNLISNAIKYTPTGGAVRVALKADNEHLVLEVADTGIGISSQDLDRVGREFFRTRQARDSGATGTGLGLTIVKSLVEGMAGDFRIESRLDEGTTITVRLPLSPPVTAA